MKTEFALAFNEVLEDKGLPKEIVLEALEAAMVSAYRRSVNASNAQHVEARIDPETGKVQIYAEKEVVDTVQDIRTEVALDSIKDEYTEAIFGSMVIVETTPGNFGRVAAQTARQVIQQRIREAEREVQYNYFSKQVGEIVNGVVQAVNSQNVALGLEMKAEGSMPRSQQIPREHFRVHDRVRALLLEVKISPRGPQIILSRAHRDFLRRLLENEVPEIYHGMVEIRSISREPGQRSKVAVAALQPGVDPVGACVGIRGVRIQAIVRELNDEKIDVIEWNPDSAAFIAKALSPARVTGVFLYESKKGAKTATVVVPEDQLSLAIGRDGQNARLAAKLTSWRIDIKSLPEAVSDVLSKIQNDPKYASFAEEEKNVTPQIVFILGKKAEGRPVTPEEYYVMSQYVDRIERGIIQQREIIRKDYEERSQAALEKIAAAAFELPLTTLNLTERVHALLTGAKYDTVGDLMFQMHMDPEAIQGLSGIGPKAMEEINNSLTLIAPEPPPEADVTPMEEPTTVEVPTEVDVQDQAEMLVPEEIQDADELTTDVGTISTEMETPAEPVEKEEPSEVEEIPGLTEGEDRELPASLEDIFKIKPDMLDIVEDEDEVDLEKLSVTSKKKTKKKKKQQKKFVDVEYDPDHDVTLYKKRRKGDDEWEI